MCSGNVFCQVETYSNKNLLLMKSLVELLLLAVAAVICTIIPHPALGSDRSLGLNTSKIFMGVYNDYGEQYNDNDFGDYDEDYSNYEDEDLDLNGGQVSASFRHNGGLGRREGFGASSNFWGRMFNIHEHHHKTVGVNWDEDEDTCSSLGTSCDSRHECCKGGICIDNSCVKCAGEGAGEGEGVGESCVKDKHCCSKFQKCINGKCTQFCGIYWQRCSVRTCTKKKCTSKPRPCCDPAYECYRNGCRARPKACQPKLNKPCNSLYPCCQETSRCIGGTCQTCRNPANGGEPCANKWECCSPNGGYFHCVKGRCSFLP